ncbi:putative tyrosine specific protein phosphatase [Helianthus annuus]|uniref:Dual specificity protein phosphatase 4 n=1 Tax=Helianthus annuus TaxID=4232 RepID=A0A251TWB5_HELAN|nr:phosphoglucan phosphatase DSP4, amyloplastic [Helianthus annuus]KAF5790103.1 putative AMP-activated kinase, glycogen-binding protein [Helianthus annuus]KAJ0533466.1 putative tyrosine specific protein phosphatase [Helianthus annuus]KAJ0541752.1 putative tyrosine specific protein phosphatase [Helianthus annuus]KAJ0706828.1 putative tyrosine specific protein phosphatase [Helianthus annuus]KAJ0752784.1 putative tyrosine specific protein phosphatase [Helianthus annuus]
MNCLQNLPRSCNSIMSSRKFKFQSASHTCFVKLAMNHREKRLMNATAFRQICLMQATPSSTSGVSTEDTKESEEKSDIYSNNMTEAMGAVLTYRHELGMNYNFITPDLIVGSCLQTPADVDKLRSIGVKTIYCLQQNSDLEYFSVDIEAIREYASTFDDIEHLRAEIRDFDAFDLRLRLPCVVSKLHKAINRNGGIAYIHCTAGLGRAPGTALAYMFWVQDYKLNDALTLLLSKRSCFPKMDAIKSATVDILTGLKRKPVTLTWKGAECSSVEISGLDIGWGQRIPLKYIESQGSWTLHRDLPEGRYEYKYIVDGEWVTNKHELLTPVDDKGNINNYLQVSDDDPESLSTALWERLLSDDFDLTTDERQVVKQFLDDCPDAE